MTHPGNVEISARPGAREGSVAKLAQLVTAHREVAEGRSAAAAWDGGNHAFTGMEFEVSKLVAEFDKVLILLM